MAAMVVDDRIRETSTTTGTGSYALAGAVTGFQPFSAIGAANYAPYFATDDVNWEVGLGTYSASPDTLARTHVLASSNGDAAVDWAAGTRKLRCGWPAWFGQPRSLSKSVAGSADVTLTALEQRRRVLILTGTLTGNISVIVDTTVWDWLVYNNTSGAFTLTVKVSGQTGVLVPQGGRSALHCNGTDVVPDADDLPQRVTVSGVISPSQITSNQNDYNPTGLATASVLRLSTDASRNITSIAGGAPGRLLVIHNAGSNALVLKDDDGATGTAANRLALANDVTLAADQVAVLQYDGTTARWRAIAAPPPAASDTVAGVLEIATQTEIETGTDVARAVSPGRQQYHPSAAKWWADWDNAGNVAVGYNVSSVTDHGTGDWTVNFSTAFSSSSHVPLAIPFGNTFTAMTVAARATGSARFNLFNSGGATDGGNRQFAAGFGDQ